VNAGSSCKQSGRLTVLIDNGGMHKNIKLYGSVLAVILLLAGWALFFHYYPVEELVADIGIQNTYFAAFMLAVIGGFSSITGTSLYAALVALARGGINPYILGLIGGFGLFISDSIFYLIATKIRSVISHITNKWERLFRKIWKWLYRTPSWIVYLGIFSYCAFAPFPNDVLLVVLALSGYSYREFAAFLLLGDITMALLLTTISSSTG
jgi:hypothetical protein